MKNLRNRIFKAKVLLLLKKCSGESATFFKIVVNTFEEKIINVSPVLEIN